MSRYQVSEFDSSTLVVVDTRTNREICIVGYYENGGEDYQERARHIADLLNQAEAE